MNTLTRNRNMEAEQLSQKIADRLLPVTVFFGILAGFGIISNAYVFYVYKYKYSRCNFRTFVLCLALIDFLGCLLVFPSEMYGHRIWFSYPHSAAWFCKVKTLLSGATIFTSSFVLLLISIDRFRKVCRPLGKQMKVKTALRLCLMIFGIGCIIVIPCPILFGIQTTNITYEGEIFKITSCMKDDAYKDSLVPTIYVATIYHSPVVAFMITTMVLYANIIRKIFFGSFLKFDEKISYMKSKVSDDKLQSTREQEACSSDTEIIHDSDEDNTDNEISDNENTELQTIDKQRTDKETESNDKNEGKDIGNSKIANGSTITEIHSTKEGKKIPENQNVKNNGNHQNSAETGKAKHYPKTSEDKSKEKSKFCQGIDSKMKLNGAEHADEQNMNESGSIGRNDTSENQNNKENSAPGIEVVHSAGNNNSYHKLHKLVLNELKSVHKQNNHTLTNTKASECKRTFGNETFKRLKSKQGFRKQNIKTRSLIMFVVTLIFTITTSIYICTVTVVYHKEHILELVAPDYAAIFFLCWRIYFVNHVINPFVYGFFDPRFRKAIRRSSQKLYHRISKFKPSSIRRSIHF